MHGFVHQPYNARKRPCTPHGVDLEKASVHHVYMAEKPRSEKVVTRFKRDPLYGKTYIYEWRRHRGLSQQRLADRLGVSHATIGRIENGKQPYSQPLLERLAEELQTDPASLLIRDPSDPEGIWTLWDRAKPAERRQIVALAATLLQTGS